MRDVEGCTHTPHFSFHPPFVKAGTRHSVLSVQLVASPPLKGPPHKREEAIYPYFQSWHKEYSLICLSDLLELESCFPVVWSSADHGALPGFLLHYIFVIERYSRSVVNRFSFSAQPALRMPCITGRRVETPQALETAIERLFFLHCVP